MTDSRKPLILVTNDDGVNALGIKMLIDAIRPLGEIVVIAPDGPRSGMSSAITAFQPLRVHALGEECDLTVYSCTGTPVDCVKLGINEILERKPDLVISGINHGSNASICVIYSGTMGAAIEGCIFGIPSIGVSLTNHAALADFTQASAYARVIAEKVLCEGLPQGVCLNVNIPDVQKVKGIRVCTQAKGRWAKEFYRSQDQMGREIFWLTGEFENEEPDNQHTDEWALANGYASVVPCQIDMTAHDVIQKLNHLSLQD